MKHFIFFLLLGLICSTKSGAQSFYPIANEEDCLEIDQQVIHPNQVFNIRFTDKTTQINLWEILDPVQGKTLSVSFNPDEFTARLEKEGFYDLRITKKDNSTRTYRGVLLVSPELKGKSPEITSLTANGSESPIQIEKNAEVNYTYQVASLGDQPSQALFLNETILGIPFTSDLVFMNEQDYTLAFWFNINQFNHDINGTNFLNIRDENAGFPYSDFGFLSTQFTVNNELRVILRQDFKPSSNFDYVLPDFTFYPNHWYHFAMSLKKADQTNYIVSIYINGIQILQKEASGLSPLTEGKDCILLGGDIYETSGFNGFIDEFKIYKKELSTEEIQASMNHDSHPSETLVGYWDFESAADTNGNNSSIGANTGLVASCVKKNMNESNDEKLIATPAEFAKGVPSISGATAFTATWQTEGAEAVTEDTHNASTGHLTVTYPQVGTFESTVTVTNDWGSASKTFRSVTVNATTSIEDSELEAAYLASPNPFDQELNLSFAQEGKYNVEVFNEKGQLLETQTVEMNSHENLMLSVNGAPGVYFVRIVQQGKIVQALKVIKR